MHSKEMEELDCVEQGALWGDEDERFNLALKNVGVDLADINTTPTCPKRAVHCWIRKREYNGNNCISDGNYIRNCIFISN